MYNIGILDTAFVMISSASIGIFEMLVDYEAAYLPHLILYNTTTVIMLGKLIFIIYVPYIQRWRNDTKGLAVSAV